MPYSGSCREREFMRFGVWMVLLLELVLSPLSMALEPRLDLGTMNYPPYIVNGERGAQGLVVNIVRTAFARIGQPINIKFYPFARGQAMLKSGQVAGFFTMKKNAERQKTLLFPKRPLISQDYVFFVRKHGHWQFNGSFSSLADAKIGVVNQTSYGNRFDREVLNGPFWQLDLSSSHEMNFRKLLAGRVDVVICSRLVGLYYLRAMNAQDQVEVTGPAVEIVDSYLGFTRSQDHQQLVREFDQALDSMQRDGTLQQLVEAAHLAIGVTPRPQ
jgi:polar amino acid transport system substrate-binding protein